ncbi:DMT family transporter [Anaerovibrio slackiae]|uniref:DMT family transporter n=1 Tax=Anaerovibrio slackiae TaxID=2652309 RepID=UPI00386BBE81
MNISSRTKGVLMAVIGSIFWGGSGVAAQFILQEKGMTADYLTAVRTIVAGILLLSIDAFINKNNIFAIWKDRESRHRLLAFGVLGMMSVQYTYFVAIECSNAPTATIIQYLMPILILAWFSITERKLPGLSQVTCAIMAIFGTALLVTHGSLTALAISDRALFWGILSAFAAAFYTVQPRWLLMRWPSPQVIGWAMLIGGAAISLIYPPLSYPGIVDIPALLSLAYICVLGTAASFWLYVTSTKYILAQEASILNATEPLASIVFSIILLDVMFELPEIIGSLLIIMPIIYITLKRK